MTTMLESGNFAYEVNMDWAKLPEGWTFHEVSDVTVDSKDRVYVFTRGKHPLIVFDRDGNFLYSWGEGIFKRPHGVTIGPYARYFISYHATREGAARVRTLDLFPTVTFSLKDAWALSFYSENPVVYNDAINKWFVPIDVLLTKRVSKSFGFGVGGAYGLVKDDPRYQYVINGRVTFYF